MMRHGHQMASKCDSELNLPQERVKCVVVGNPEAVVGTSTASYDLVHAPCAVTIRRRASAHSEYHATP